MNSGAITGIGTACEPITSGRSVLRSGRAQVHGDAERGAERERGGQPEHDLARW